MILEGPRHAASGGDGGCGEPEFGATPRDELAYRLRQQQILSDFSFFALRSSSIEETMHQATVAGAEGLHVELCKFLQHDPVVGRLVLRAGVGWKEGSVGNVTMGIDLESPAGYAFRTGTAVLSNHLEIETRFRTPDLLAEYGVRRALNVPVCMQGKAFGVLEVDSRNIGKFTEADIAFLGSLANVLSVVIERDAKESELAAALDREKVLAGEMRHRVKNLFAVVHGLISQARREVPGSHEASAVLERVSERIAALSRATEVGLIQGEDVKGRRFDPIEQVRLVLAPYGDGVVVDGKAASLPESHLTSLALILHELATNAMKYGALSSANGQVRVTWWDGSDGPAFTWAESGVTISPDEHAEGFGAQMIRRLLRSMGGAIEREWWPGGLTVTVRLGRPAE